MLKNLESCTSQHGKIQNFTTKRNPLNVYDNTLLRQKSYGVKYTTPWYENKYKSKVTVQMKTVLNCFEILNVLFLMYYDCLQFKLSFTAMVVV